MVKATQAGTELCLSNQQFSSKATLKLTDGVKASLTHRTGSKQGYGLTLTGKKWEVAHDFVKNDTRFKYKTKLPRSVGTLTVKQAVPGGKWWLIPNPAFELSRTGDLGKDSRLAASYDFMERVGTLEQTVYSGKDKRNKATLKLSSKTGPVFGLRSKVQAGPLLHSAAASFSQKGGWQLAAKSRFSDGTKVKTSYALQSETLTVSAKHTPKSAGNEGLRPTVTLSMIIPCQQQADPRVTLGLKWDM